MFYFKDFVRGFLQALVILMFLGGLISTIIMFIAYVSKELSFEWIHILAPLAICLAPALWNGFDLDD